MIKWIKKIFKKVESDIKSDIAEARKSTDLIGAYIVSIENKYNSAIKKYESEISDLKAKLSAIENFINTDKAMVKEQIEEVEKNV